MKGFLQLTAEESLDAENQTQGVLQSARRFFRTLITLDVLLAFGAIANALAYIHSKNNSPIGTATSSILIILLVVDLALAIAMWCSIPNNLTLHDACSGPIFPQQSQLKSLPSLAFWNVASNAVTTLVWFLVKLTTTRPTVMWTWKFWLVLILFGALRSVKLHPLVTFWKVTKLYEEGYHFALLQWRVGACEQYTGMVLDAMVIITLVVVLGTALIFVCFIYVKGGSLSGTFNKWQAGSNSTTTTRPSWLEPIEKPSGVPTQGSTGYDNWRPTWLDPVPTPSPTGSQWAQPRRLKLPNCHWDCSDDVLGECCCNPNCDSGVSFSPKTGADDDAVKAIEFGGGGAVVGAGIGAGVGLAMAADIAAGTAVGGPVGAAIGFGVAAIPALLAALVADTEDPGCVGKCNMINVDSIWCYCTD